MWAMDKWLSKIKNLKKPWKIAGVVLVVLIIFWQIVSKVLVNRLITTYQNQESQILYDRNGKLISIKPNPKGYYNQFLTLPPKEAENILLKKEDKYFYWHFGINPFSIMRDLWAKLITGKRSGSSTLSQQLVKTLLGNEQDRGARNKFKEMFYTLALEWHRPKKEILTMYFNSVYFGGLAQGYKEASFHYFNKPPENLSSTQILSLLSTLNNPSQSQAGTAQNLKRAKNLAKEFKLNVSNDEWNSLGLVKADEHRNSEVTFELASLNLNCPKVCNLTIDSELTKNLRGILKRNLERPDLDTASTGAVVVIKMPENEVVAIVGSPDTSSSSFGHQVNMAVRPRAVGSTAKPFIYLKAFEKGARPYTLVSDQELKYQIGTGFDFFPKNFDGQYRGQVTLEEALSNSLNVPTVQVLDFAGLQNFYKFLGSTMGFKPQQPLENYELGIALGGLESDLLTWSNYFTIFGQGGYLKPLTIFKSGFTDSPYLKTPMANLSSSPVLAGEKQYVELVNKILSNRDAGVAQFGIKSNLNLPYQNYALKTGTSRDYHDSWTLGYSPDFLVGVWVGNSSDKPMREVTGLSGAAKIWRETMLYMYNSPYNKSTQFNFSDIKEFNQTGSIEYGLVGDNYKHQKNLILNPSLILTPHQGDKYLLQKNTTIPLTASKEVDWYVDNKLISHSTTTNWQPKEAGKYKITAASNEGKKEEISIEINLEDKKIP